PDTCPEDGAGDGHPSASRAGSLVGRPRSTALGARCGRGLTRAPRSRGSSWRTRVPILIRRSWPRMVDNGRRPACYGVFAPFRGRHEVSGSDKGLTLAALPGTLNRQEPSVGAWPIAAKGGNAAGLAGPARVRSTFWWCGGCRGRGVA